LSAIETANQIDVHIGARIEMRRVSLGLTREAMAQALNVTVLQVEAFETGAVRVSAGRLFELADLFDVKVAYFFENERFPSGAISAPGALHELDQAR
jgi:transcriptional regulator with XRE-family HTH domain